MSPTIRPFETFELNVLGAEGHLWLSAQSEQGSIYAVPRPPLTFELSGGFTAPVEWLKHVIGQARVDARDDAMEIGSKLLDLTFGVPEIAALFQQTRGVAASRGAQVLFRVLAAPDALSAWPWELLLDPQQPTRFLTLSRDTHVVRAGRERTYPPRRDWITPPLNLLLVLSSPLRESFADDETPFDLYEEKRQLVAELQPLVDRGLLRVEVVDRPSIEQLRARMSAQQRGFHVLHYVGHAQPQGLKLEQRSGRGRLVASVEFSRLLQELPDLRLAVFAGCETARAPESMGGELLRAWPGQLSTADHCVRDACPMVVGMQAVLPFGTERLFTRYFYQALTGGRPVAEAARLARLAIAEDEHAGGDRLNWAVPCLFVGGTDPGPLVDPDARAVPRAAVRRKGVRLGVRQGELRFISRLAELRTAIDVLSARSDTRVLLISGARGTGKSAFLDRAVEELDASVVYLLVSAQRLLEEDDPLEFLCERVAELLARVGRKAPKRVREAPVWWELLLEVVADTPFALAIDDADLLTNGSDEVAALRDAIQHLTGRRGQARLALASADEVTSLVASVEPAYVRPILLQPLLWYDVWQWIRRNLPVLTRFEEAQLSACYADLPRLEDWEQLAEEVSRGVGATADELPTLVRRVASSLGSVPSQASAPPPVFGVATSAAEKRTVGVRAPRALRVAVAGPHTSGRADEFARGITRYAAEHHVAGRVDTSSDPTSRLAELVDVPSPFDETGSADMSAITRWLDSAREAGAELILLDFGSSTPNPVWDTLLNALVKDDRLVIAAGGNDGVPAYPAWCAGALAVGALGADSQPTAYSIFDPDATKPEVFAPESVADSSLAVLVVDSTAIGTSFAALHALAAATLVWATDREQSAREVRATLVETATVVDAGGARRLDVDEALARARRQVLLDSLESGPLELHDLLAAAGMRPELALPLLEEAVRDERVRRIVQEGTEHYENPSAAYLAYVEARLAPPGPARTKAMDQLVDRVRSLAARGRYRPDRIRAMWESGHEGRRVAALGAIQQLPELGSAAIVLEGITSSQSAFEQFHALLAAEAMLPVMTPDERTALRAAVAEQRGPSGRIENDRSRTRIADRLLAALG